MKAEKDSELGVHPSSSILHPSCAPPACSSVLIKRLGRVDYAESYRAMRDFTAQREPHTADEIWLVEHFPVYTTGLNAKREHFPKRDSGIPLVTTDRGGQITYHGPGQAVVYLLLDLKRRKKGARALVRLMEDSVIDLLRCHAIAAQTIRGMPGVYVDGAKICSVGLRISRGCSYHGLALNVDMDLGPFAGINPCGYPGLRVTQTRDLGIKAEMEGLSQALGDKLAAALDVP